MNISKLDWYAARQFQPTSRLVSYLIWPLIPFITISFCRHLQKETITVRMCVSSILAMHPKGIGRYYALANTSYYATLSLVQKPTVRPARPLPNTMLDVTLLATQIAII